MKPILSQPVEAYWPHNDSGELRQLTIKWLDDDDKAFEVHGPYLTDSPVDSVEHTPVTILAGHLAESLRWRKMDEVPTHLTEGLYVVSRLGLCRLEESSFDEGAFNWIAGSGDYPVEDYEIYRPAIPGIDYVEGV